MVILAGRARQAGDRAGCRVRARRGQASVRSRSESVRPRGQLPDGQKKSGFGSGGGLAWARLGWVRGWHVPGQGAAERGLCGARGRPGTGQGPRGPDPRRGAPTTPIPMSLLKKRMVLSENLVMNVCFFQTFVFRLVAKVRQANSEPSLVRDLCWDLKKSGRVITVPVHTDGGQRPGTGLGQQSPHGEMTNFPDQVSTPLKI